MSGRADDIATRATDAFRFAFRTVIFAAGASAALGAGVAWFSIAAASRLRDKPSA
jgi:hypothetical protein